jgi:glyoxylase-like metal-dependent hydrolase (beta-lactamase superfamily II)
MKSLKRVSSNILRSLKNLTGNGISDTLVLINAKSRDYPFKSDTNIHNIVYNTCDAENITPEPIDTVVISHYHQDHIGGLADNAGNPTFPKA